MFSKINRLLGNYRQDERRVLVRLSTLAACQVVAAIALIPFLYRSIAGVVSLILLVGSAVAVCRLGQVVAKLYTKNRVLLDASGEETHAAMHDALTGVANRRMFEQTLDALVNQHGPKHVLMMLDLDRFKPVNDLHGHAAGDALLKDIASGLTRIIKPRDMVARLGGDEFAIILQDTDPQIAEAVAVRALDFVIKFRLNWEGQRISVGTSIGMVHIDKTEQKTAELMAIADEALYAAKEAGRGVAYLAKPGKSIGEPHTFERVGKDVAKFTSKNRSHEPEDGRKQELYGLKIAFLQVEKDDGSEDSGSRGNNVKHWVLTDPRTIGDSRCPGMKAQELIECASNSLDAGADLARWVLINTLYAASQVKPAALDHLGFVMPMPASAVISSPKLIEELLRVNALSSNPLKHYTYLLYGVGNVYDRPEIKQFKERLEASNIGLAFEISSSTLDVLAPLHRVNYNEVYLGRELSRNLRPGTPAAASLEALANITKQHGTSIVASGTETEAEVRHLAHVGVTRFSGPIVGQAQPLATLVKRLSNDLDKRALLRKSA